jgi:hypothetical protein
MASSKNVARIRAIAKQLDSLAETLLDEDENELSDICSECSERLNEAIVSQTTEDEN